MGTITEQNSDSVPAGSVISQDPVGGTQVAPGSAVDLVVLFEAQYEIVSALSLF